MALISITAAQECGRQTNAWTPLKVTAIKSSAMTKEQLLERTAGSTNTEKITKLITSS